MSIPVSFIRFMAYLFEYLYNTEKAPNMATRKRFTAAMEKMGFNIPDSKTNFVFAGSGRIAGADYFHELRKRNIIVRYFDKDPIRDYVRITIGTDEDMDLLLKATEEILKEAGK